MDGLVAAVSDFFWYVNPLWIKAWHVISIIAWMAGLLYLPRLMVYHTKVAAGSEQSELFKVMERRLLKAIMTPAMVASWIFGLWAATITYAWDQGWFHFKLALVVLLTISHLFMARWVREFAEDRNTRPEKFYRAINEVPTLLMIGIVILVIVRPF
ncbi:protoporphyrinogen oxidase HemJ [Afifella marina]|uniref:Protoporphyrinogen IX oxidase n=1 Tax=Afifella marina DSM 2698 TaxID=1120955 RepID=A0A1G5NE48_AFIMA|nr:protoporphyrinogen oxidase HemJ [Afifella marina]MBK1623403.1 TIGR00701 family protein [Afifella marina DSM 2698]MBK1626397.1 TIGR00701 family protein [Afifella marina]MBK5917275.1 TIGR00701 family protein [Afifella marina]RAI18073.1 TIGR00701 family protein [Afifella marina DSM 2698]SCZ35655.1 putative membrane protein [Afifella marina DSM 2698]